MKWFLGLAAVVIIIALIVLSFNPWILFIKWAQHRRVVLLCKTDHQALLDAGREILSKSPPIENRTKEGHRIIGNLSVPKNVPIPKAVRALAPRGILRNYDGYLTLEMHGGMDHFGVHIYPENFKEPEESFSYGDRELIPGLWYYDDGYSFNSEYDKRIDKIIEEHK